MSLLFIIIYITCYISQPPTEHQGSLFVRSGQSSSKGTTISALLKNRLPLYKATNLSVAFSLLSPIQIKSVARAARAARLLAQFLDAAAKRRREILR